MVLSNCDLSFTTIKGLLKRDTNTREGQLLRIHRPHSTSLLLPLPLPLSLPSDPARLGGLDEARPDILGVRLFKNVGTGEAGRSNERAREERGSLRGAGLAKGEGEEATEGRRWAGENPSEVAALALRGRDTSREDEKDSTGERPKWVPSGS